MSGPFCGTVARPCHNGVWVDPNSGLPVRNVIELFNSVKKGKQILSFSNFTWNELVAPEMFNLEVLPERRNPQLTVAILRNKRIYVKCRSDFAARHRCGAAPQRVARTTPR